MTKLKWCIKRTEENYKEVNEWANNKCPKGDIYSKHKGYINSEPDDMGNPLMSNEKQPDFHEITLDEFRLLTNPENYYKYAFRRNSESIEYIPYFKGKEATPFQWQAFSYTPVSEPVFQELQRMWKEKEREKEFVHVTTVEGIEADGIAYKKALIKEMEENPELFQLVAITCDKPTDQNKQLKLLKKIDKKLTKLIKKQKHQF